MVIRKKLDSRQELYTYLMIVASCICLVVQLYAIPRNHTTLMSIANKGLLLLWLGVGGIRIAMKLATAFPVKLISFLGILLLTLVAFLIAAFKSTSYISNYLTSFLNFMVLPVMLLFSTVYTIPEKAKNAMVVTGALLAAVFIALYHSGLRNVFIGPYATIHLPQVTLGYYNPNQAAMYLFAGIIILVTSVFYVRRKLSKVLLGLAAVYLSWIMLRTETRTAILLLAAFLALTVVTWKWTVPKCSIDIAIFTPFVYAFLAMFFFAVFGTIEIGGESLFNGRENIFNRYLSNLNPVSFFFGNYARFNFTNLHNSYVSIAATAGIFAVVAYMAFLRKCLQQNYRNALSQRYSAVSFAGFLCVLVYSSTEAAYFVGGSTYAFLIFMIFLFFSQPSAALSKEPK